MPLQQREGATNLFDLLRRDGSLFEELIAFVFCRQKILDGSSIWPIADEEDGGCNIYSDSFSKLCMEIFLELGLQQQDLARQKREEPFVLRFVNIEGFLGELHQLKQWRNKLLETIPDLDRISIHAVVKAAVDRGASYLINKIAQVQSRETRTITPSFSFSLEPHCAWRDETVSGKSIDRSGKKYSIGQSALNVSFKEPLEYLLGEDAPRQVGLYDFGYRTCSKLFVRWNNYFTLTVRAKSKVESFLVEGKLSVIVSVKEQLKLGYLATAHHQPVDVRTQFHISYRQNSDIYIRVLCCEVQALNSLWLNQEHFAELSMLAGVERVGTAGDELAHILSEMLAIANRRRMNGKSSSRPSTVCCQLGKLKELKGTLQTIYEQRSGDEQLLCILLDCEIRDEIMAWLRLLLGNNLQRLLNSIKMDSEQLLDEILSLFNNNKQQITAVQVIKIPCLLHLPDKQVRYELQTWLVSGVQDYDGLQQYATMFLTFCHEQEPKKMLGCIWQQPKLMPPAIAAVADQAAKIAVADDGALQEFRNQKSKFWQWVKLLEIRLSMGKQLTKKLQAKNLPEILPSKKQQAKPDSMMYSTKPQQNKYEVAGDPLGVSSSVENYTPDSP